MRSYAKNLLEIQKTKKRIKYIKNFIFIFVIFTFLLQLIISSLLNFSTIKVTAHRGSTFISPENTIASILEAITQDIDYIEIDVQLTKDGKVILLHDSTFYRTAGVKIKPSELTYEEIQKINVGNYKSDAFFHSAPLLENVLDICPKTITLNIELKDYGNNQQLPQKVIAILEEKNCINNVVISSNSISFLRIVNALNPEIKVGLITSSALFSTYNKKFIDFYSINYNAITPSLVLYIHSLGKQVYCWTPNSKITINYAIYSGVDNIITDRTSLAKILITKKLTSSFIQSD